MPIRYSRRSIAAPDPSRLPLILGTIWLAIMAMVSAQATAGCRITEPVFAGATGVTTVTLSIDCTEDNREGDVSYPQGVLHVGMSLFDVGAGEGESSIKAGEGEHFVEPAEIDFGAGERSTVLHPGTLPPGATHYVMALWSEKTECVNAEAQVCFGPYDGDLFPIPLDTYPRPICDRPALEAKGYFDWAENGDPSGYQADEGIKTLFDTVDCYRGNQTAEGLGVSLKSWRVVPVPTGRN